MQFGQALAGYRRQQRLSQLALSQKSGVSQRHISFLESGRSNPGTRTVHRLANALELSYADSNVLFASAGLSPPRPSFDLIAHEFEPAKRAIESLLRKHTPFPAVVTARSGEIKFANTAFGAALTWAFPGTRPREDASDWMRNLFSLTLHPEGLLSFMVNPEEIVPHTLRRLQAAATIDDSARKVRDQVMAAEALDPYRALAETPSSASSSVLVERYSIRGEPLKLVSMVSSFGSPEDVTAQALQVELFFPDDEQSEAILTRLGGDDG